MARAKAKYELTAQDKTGKAFRSFRQNLQQSSRAAAGFGRSMLGVAGIGGIGLMIKRSIDSKAELAKLSRSMKISTEDLSKLRFAAESGGISFGTMTNGLFKMQRSIADAAKGTNDQSRAFETLELRLDHLRAMDPAEQFKTIADAISRIEDPTEQAQVGMAVFGRQFMELNKVIAEGRKQIEEYGKRLQELGGVISKDTAETAEQASQDLQELKELGSTAGDWLAGAAIVAIKGTWANIQKAIGGTKEEMIALKAESEKFSTRGQALLGLGPSEVAPASVLDTDKARRAIQGALMSRQLSEGGAVRAGGGGITGGTPMRTLEQLQKDSLAALKSIDRKVGLGARAQ